MSQETPTTYETQRKAAKLIDACVAEGSMAPDRNPADVLLLMGFLWRVAPNEDGIAQGRRLIELVFDGLGPR